MIKTDSPLKIILCAPRGFCAGVDRAIQIVEKSLEKYGAPVYVRHEIVHNKFVVETLRSKGAVFIEELNEIPENHYDRPVIFSAHGVPKSVPADAQKRNMFYIDATCPLVTKVHYEAARHHKMGLDIILIGHTGHPEVVGTMGQLPEDSVFLVETVEDVERLNVSDPTKLAYCSQTTLSVDDTSAIVEALRQKFPAIIGPSREDICYATTNRQEAVKAIAPNSDALFVIGSPNSSNSNRLVEVAKSYGCPKAFLVQDESDIPWDRIADIRTLGLTAGASAPDILIDNVITALGENFEVKVEEVVLTKENVTFNIPRLLREAEEQHDVR
ncbi:MAG: 4-hydroxy-3-methylbut-2-enyl diphosphate reductase [Alphaproteobacteria bacterium]|nr:4-hydroxy-3-methylbut-2-enyl diphosphate reductase [Alphaproteobacteria bacterium]MCB9984497.1 4-hydroxy-3-methylbut-2-enyl diphosphate reductase [Micavibrio sp.]HPQ50632.1 4-hydroxy-3-methylbut-2-enyl diphosphate reductase [Alphaproteobacteria bacterium]